MDNLFFTWANPSLEDASEEGQRRADEAAEYANCSTHIDLRQRVSTQDETARADHTAQQDGQDDGHEWTYTEKCTVGYDKSDDASSSGCVHTHLPEAVDGCAADLYEDGCEDDIDHEAVHMQLVQDVEQGIVAEQMEHIGHETFVAMLPAVGGYAECRTVEIGEQGG